MRITAYKLPLWNRSGELVAYTRVDFADWITYKDLLWHWRQPRGSTRGYAARATGQTVHLLHRLIMEAPGGLVVDHINRDSLDNRRSNLRVITRAQNQHNLSPYKGTTSRYRGVCWDRARAKWTVTCTIGGVHHRLGRFDDEDEAGRVAREFRLAHMSHAVD